MLNGFLFWVLKTSFSKIGFLNIFLHLHQYTNLNLTLFSLIMGSSQIVPIGSILLQMNQESHSAGSSLYSHIFMLIQSSLYQCTAQCRNVLLKALGNQNVVYPSFTKIQLVQFYFFPFSISLISMWGDKLTFYLLTKRKKLPQREAPSSCLRFC